MPKPDESFKQSLFTFHIPHFTAQRAYRTNHSVLHVTNNRLRQNLKLLTRSIFLCPQTCAMCYRCLARGFEANKNLAVLPLVVSPRRRHVKILLLSRHIPNKPIILLPCFQHNLKISVMPTFQTKCIVHVQGGGASFGSYAAEDSFSQKLDPCTCWQAYCTAISASTAAATAA